MFCCPVVDHRLSGCSPKGNCQPASPRLFGPTQSCCCCCCCAFHCTGIYDPAFIAANQESRADNVIKGSRQQQVDTVRQQIRQFKADNGVDKVIVLWTANTERYSQVGPHWSCSPTPEWSAGPLVRCGTSTVRAACAIAAALVT